MTECSRAPSWRRAAVASPSYGRQVGQVEQAVLAQRLGHDSVAEPVGVELEQLLDTFRDDDRRADAGGPGIRRSV